MPANDDDFGKIQEILDYLTVEFPEGLVEHKYVTSRTADIIFISFKGHTTQISISKAFLKANKPYDIEAKLVHFQLAESIRKKKPAHIALTNSGLNVDIR